jgi:murein peptide amidase A
MGTSVTIAETIFLLASGSSSWQVSVRNRSVTALATVASLVGAVLVTVQWSPSRADAATPVQAKKIIGYSVRHRPIVAYHLGDTTLARTSVILGQMHGDEHAGVTLVNSIVRGDVSVEGINLWVIPTMNPDGDAVHTRQNAHHVDLNRNWPDRWAHLTGQYYSGPEPLSEPETRAMYAFLKGLRPHYLVSLHQPLKGVDTTDGGSLDHAFRDVLAANLGLPLKAFRCWSICHGSMTGWYTTHRYGIGETVEFGWHPTTSYLTGHARRGMIAALGGHFGSLAAHNPRSSLRVGVSAEHARLSGWAFDIDARSAHVAYTASRDGHVIRTAKAWSASPELNATYDLTGEHAFAFTAAATPGTHTFCLVFTNIAAGTANPKRCATVTVPASPTSTPTPTPTPTGSA